MSKKTPLDFQVLGAAIRERRKVLGVTLMHLADKTGVAQATLSRVETGSMPGTVECHFRIAQALKMSLSDLYAVFDEPKRRGEKTSSQDRRLLAAKSGRIHTELLTQPAPHKNLEPAIVSLEPRTSADWSAFPEGTEVFYYVLEGSCEVELAGEAIGLARRDSLYLDGSRRHRLANHARSRARVLVVTA